ERAGRIKAGRARPRACRRADSRRQRLRGSSKRRAKRSAPRECRGGRRASLQPALLAQGGRMSGVVYLVGAGPGAPDLLTLRAAKLLEKADIVFHDALVHPDTIALAPRAEKVAVGKRCGKHSTAQKF